MGEQLRYVRLVALTLRSGWFAMGSRWIGLCTQRESTIRRSATLSMRGEGYGQVATLSRGGFACVSGKAGGRATVRTMQTRILNPGTQCSVLMRRSVFSSRVPA
jgi:hypothetical protein